MGASTNPKRATEICLLSPQYFSRQSFCSHCLPPPTSTSHLNPSFLCPSSSLGTEQSLTLPHCISLKRVASWSLPTTCPAPLKQREGSRGPVKCFKLFHSWGLSKARPILPGHGASTAPCHRTHRQSPHLQLYSVTTG